MRVGFKLPLGTGRVSVLSVVIFDKFLSVVTKHPQADYHTDY